MTRLRNLQLRFQDYLLGSSEDIERDIVSTEDARAEHRLGAYYNAYRIRLIDCLAIDYSALETILGRNAFEELALDYLDLYPSTQPSVRWFGRHLPEYLHGVYRGQDRELLAELERGELKLESVLVYYRMGQLLDTVNEALRTIIQEFEDPSGEIRPAARLGGSMRPA